MMAPRAMTAAVMGLPNRSQGEAAFLQRQCARVRSGKACGRARAGTGGSRPHQTKERAIVLPVVRPDDCPTADVYGSLRLCAQHGLRGLSACIPPLSAHERRHRFNAANPGGQVGARWATRPEPSSQSSPISARSPSRLCSSSIRWGASSGARSPAPVRSHSWSSQACGCSSPSTAATSGSGSCRWRHRPRLRPTHWGERLREGVGAPSWSV